MMFGFRPLPTDFFQRPSAASAHISLVLFLLACAAFSSGSLAQRGPADIQVPTADSYRPEAITVQTNMGAGGNADVVKFSPDGRYLVEGDGRQLRLWDIRTGRPLRTLDHFTYFQHFVFIDGGKRIMTVHKDGRFRIWDPMSGRLLATTNVPGKGGGSHIPSMYHNLGKNFVAIPFQNGPILLWDYARRQRIAEFAFGTGIQSEGSPDAVWVSSDGNRLIAIEDATLRYFDVRSRKATRTIELPKGYRLASEGGLLSDRHLIAKTDMNDCDADIVLVSHGMAETRFRTLERAPGCKPAGSGQFQNLRSYGSIKLHYLADLGRVYISREGVDGVKAWDIATGRPLELEATLRRQTGTLMAFDDRLALAAFAQQGELRIVNLVEGRHISSLKAHGTERAYAIASADGRQMMLHQEADGKHSFTFWPVEGVSPRFHSVRLPEGYHILHAAPDAGVALGSDGKGKFVVHSLLSGEQIARFALSGIEEVGRARLFPNGRHMLISAKLAGTAGSKGDADVVHATYLVDTASGRVLRQFRPVRHTWEGIDADPSPDAGAFSFSADGSRFAIAWWSFGVEIWSLQPLRLIKRMDAPQSTSLAFSANGRSLIVGSRDEGIFVFSSETGKVLRKLERESVAGHVNTGSVAVSHDGELVAAGPSQRAVSSGDVGRERRIHVWETATGKSRFLLSGHEQNVTALAFTHDGRWLVSGSVDGTIRYWDRKTGQLAATCASTPDGRWVIVTEKGLFAASADAGDLLSVVRGFEATSIEQMWQSLYAPDLVRAFVAGDPDGEVKAATANADLATILDSGPAPEVSFTARAAGSATTELVKVDARITDRGKGIGRVEWRANGVTVAVGPSPAVAGGVAVVTQEIALDLGDNVIEVLAYTANNLLASLPARTTIRLDTTAGVGSTKPRLHVLAIGINAYTDQGWRPPGATQAVRFPKLELATRDATTIANDLKQAAAGLYSDVRITLALDHDATRTTLDATVARLSGEIHPRDTFILFVAAHGKSERGRFYIIPQDFQSGPDALERSAIGQDMLQDWLANRIKARKALILLDTCESGALVAGHLRSRTEAAASEGAIGRLHEATGRPVLTAAASGKPALEGFNDHGVFTWALRDALRHGDTNGNGTIELMELVSHVQDRVPRISAELQGTGRAAIAVATRASAAVGPASQTARFGSRGENFALTRHLQPSADWKTHAVYPATATVAAPSISGAPTASLDARANPQPQPNIALTGTYKAHVGFALHGGDLENVPGHDRASCEQLCRGRSGCAAFVFDRWNRWCHLKASVTTLRRHPKFETFIDSGVMNVALSSSAEQIMRLRGKSFRDDTPYAARPVGSYEACERSCSGEGKCSGFSFVRRGGSCRLFSTLSEYFSADGIDSGYKEQDPPPSR